MQSFLRDFRFAIRQLRKNPGFALVTVLTAIGGVIGLVAALGLTRVIASMLYEVKAFDPSSFLTVPLLIAIVAVGASAVPAIRAMAVDPMAAER